ncbi:hypothetical protein [Streptomyces sp. NBC_00989]|uniref:hypothetical protein n=1 Tax=Streptomyces sp. NBC_00989 TaxID=2903705 RepID=UPI002F9162C8|nr:hypothetical protein OG714_55115 [Streptomyces sp. NBC_00989]
MTTNPQEPHTAAAAAATALIAAHPSLAAESVDVTDVTGLGPAALIQVDDRETLRAWAQALNTTGHTTGASAYGTTEPSHDGMPDWLWWRMTYIDTTVDQTPIRLWTMETSNQPRALAALLAATAHAANGTTRRTAEPCL